MVKSAIIEKVQLLDLISSILQPEQKQEYLDMIHELMLKVESMQ